MEKNGGDGPAYQMLARQLRAAILQGQYSNGVRLPTEAELVEQYGVSRQTVRRAFHDLVAEGMVSRFAGRGTFVAERQDRYLRQFGSVEDLMNLSIDTTMQILDPLQRRIDISAAGRLRLDDDAVYATTFVRLHHDTPFCLTSVSIPPEVAAKVADLRELSMEDATSDVTVVGLLDARLGDPIAEADQSITAVSAPAAVADALGCQAGAPLLRIDRLYLTTSGRPVELAISYFLPEQYSYRLRLRRSMP